MHKRRSEKEKPVDSKIITASYEILNACMEEVKVSIIKVSKILNLTYINFYKEKHKELKNLRKETKELFKEIKEIRNNIPQTLRKFEDKDLVIGHHYVQIVTYMKEMSNSLMHIVQPAFDHLDNNHSFEKEKMYKLKEYNEQLSLLFKDAVDLLTSRDFSKMNELVLQRNELVKLTNEILLNQVKTLKKIQKGAKLSATYIEMLSETKNLILNLVQLVKANAKLTSSLLTDEELLLEEVMD